MAEVPPAQQVQRNLYQRAVHALRTSPAIGVAAGTIVGLGVAGLIYVVSRNGSGPAERPMQLTTQPTTQPTAQRVMQPTTQLAMRPTTRQTTQAVRDTYEVSGGQEDVELSESSVSGIVVGGKTYVVRPIPPGYTASICGDDVNENTIAGYLVDTQNARIEVTSEGTTIEPVEKNPYVLVNVIKQDGLIVHNLGRELAKTGITISRRNLEERVQNDASDITRTHTFVPTTGQLNKVVIRDMNKAREFYVVPVSTGKYALGDAIDVALVELPADVRILEERVEGEEISTSSRLYGSIFVPLRSRGLVKIPATQPATQPAREPDVFGEFEGVMTIPTTRPTTTTQRSN